MARCVGCGLDVNGTTGLLEVQMRPGGGIMCDNTATSTAGIYVDGTAGGTVITDDSATIDFTGTGGSGSHLTAVVKKSTAACNGIRLDGDGVYSPCPDAIVGVIQNDSVNNNFLAGPGLGITAGNSYLFGSGSPNNIGNPLCCEVGGIIAIRAGGLYLEAANNFYGTCRLQVAPNGPLVDASPDTTIVFENKSGSTVHSSFNGLVDENVVLVPAGGSVTYGAAVVVDVIAGSGTLTGFIRFEFVLTLPQTGCC